MSEFNYYEENTHAIENLNAQGLEPWEISSILSGFGNSDEIANSIKCLTYY